MQKLSGEKGLEKGFSEFLKMYLGSFMAIHELFNMDSHCTMLCFFALHSDTRENVVLKSNFLQNNNKETNSHLFLISHYKPKLKK